MPFTGTVPVPSVGYRSNYVGIGIEGTQNTPVVPTTFCQYTGESFKNKRDFIDVQGLHGQRSLTKDRWTYTVTDPRGGMTIEGLKAIDSQLLAFLALGGGAGSGSSWPTNTLPTASLYVDKVAELMSFSGCMCSKWELSSSAKAQGLKSVSDFVAMTQYDNLPGGISYSFDASKYTSGGPLCHRESTFLYYGNQIPIDEITFTVENKLYEDGWRNSSARVILVPEGERKVTCKFHIDWSASSDNWQVYTDFVAGNFGAVKLSYSDGTHTFTLQMNNVWPDMNNTPEVKDRNMMMAEVLGECRASAPGYNDEVVYSYA